MSEHADTESRTAQIDAVLPQTQCRKCGYEGCLPYAKAMVEGIAPINRCPPGGAAGIARLAALLDVPTLPLDPQCGQERAAELAIIDEAHCIGCTLCIQACPVDAIVGAPKQMHTVLLAHCTGCELCIPPCPVDCITMEPAKSLADRNVDGARRRLDASREDSAAADRARYMARTARLAQQKIDDGLRLLVKAEAKLQALDGSDAETLRKRETVERALERARARRADTRSRSGK